MAEADVKRGLGISRGRSRDQFEDGQHDCTNAEQGAIENNRVSQLPGGFVIDRARECDECQDRQKKEDRICEYAHARMVNGGVSKSYV